MIIAIDGFSACGKSTLAKDLAAKLGFGYIDTGAMYRCCTLYILEANIPLHNTAAVQELLSTISIDFKMVDGQNTTFLNGQNVEHKIRSQAVNAYVSEVAALPFVRKLMVAQQRKMAQTGDYILDGRDIGTVVFPQADLKIFVTADVETRVDRRWHEIGADLPRVEIAENLKKRDYIDSHREDSPLKQAQDARLLDNSTLTKEEQLDLVLGWVKALQTKY